MLLFSPICLCNRASAMPAFGHFGIDVSLLTGFGYSYYSGTPISGVSMGGRIAYHLNPSWEAGISYSTYPINPGYTGANTAFTFILGDINYHLSGALHPLYIGALLGIGMYNTTAVIGLSNNSQYTYTSSSISAFTAGGRVGYDFDIGYGLSIGPEARFSITFGTPSPTTNMQASGVVRYSF